MKTMRLILPWAVLLATVPLRAAEGNEEWLALVTPTRFLEAGLTHTPDGNPALCRGRQGCQGGDHAWASFDLAGVPGWGEQSRDRWRLNAQNLGLGDREWSLSYARQGLFRFSLERQDLHHYLATNNYHTPFLGAGSTVLGLPTGFPVANPLVGAATVNASQQPFQIGIGRSREKASASLWLSPHWEARAEYREDKENGTRTTGAVYGSSGSAIAMLLPEPVMTTTRRLDASLAWQQEARRFEFAYRGSLFQNDVAGWTFASPFTVANTQALNRMGSAPDNQAHQISLTGAWPFSRAARLSGSLAWGRLTQNESFLPYSTAAGSPALPQASLNGLVLTRIANLKLSSRPMRDLAVNVTYRFDSRDNRTPVTNYTLPGATAAGNGEVGGNTTRSNTPYSRSLQNLKLESVYALRPGSDLTASLEREGSRRYCNGRPDCTEVGHAVEYTGRLEWRREFSPTLSGRVSLAAAERRGDSYQRYASSVELAGMRKFFLADRDRTQFRSQLTALPAEGWSLGLALDLNQDRYRHSPYGLQSANDQIINLDLSRSLDEDVSASLFATRERIRSRLASSYSTASVGGVSTEKAASQWQAAMDEDMDSAGLSLRHKAFFGGRLDIKADLALVWSRAPYQVTGGDYSASTAPTVLQPAALPVIKSRSSEFRLNAAYTLSDRSTVRLAWLYRRAANSDFALDLYSSNNLTRILSTQETALAGSIHAIGVSYQHHFR